MRTAKIWVTILLFITLLFSGCVSKSNYDKAQSDLTTAQLSLTATTAERDATRAQLSSVQSDLSTTQQSLDAATAERDAARVQLSGVKSDLTTFQQSLSAATAERDAAKARLSSIQSDLTTAQQSLATLNSSLKAGQPYVDIARGYLNLEMAFYTGSSTDTLTAMGQITVSLAVANDKELETAWDTLLENDSDANYAAFIKLLSRRLTETKPKIN
jgi:peptidoglycan hydrolase CwlO-like protein